MEQQTETQEIETIDLSGAEQVEPQEQTDRWLVIDSFSGRTETMPSAQGMDRPSDEQLTRFKDGLNYNAVNIRIYRGRRIIEMSKSDLAGIAATITII